MDGHTLKFIYGSTGPVAVVYDGTVYYYVTNLQGDITYIVDSSGAVVVSYSYDAWGNTRTIYDATTGLGTYNPLRYRSYVYDQETKLYYLQSRYYDPEVGRFLNADNYASTGQGLLGHNMLAYCNNNPVNFSDPTGLCKNTFSIYFKVDCGKDNCKTSSAYLPIEERLEQRDVVYEPHPSGNGGKIINSYKVTDPQERTEFATYLRTNTDDFSGSVEAIVYEWELHNLLYVTTKEGDAWHDSAKDVDLGRTIYDDNHGIFSIIMWAGFELLFPEQAAADRLANQS